MPQDVIDGIRKMVACTPSDTATFDTTKGVYATVAGNIAVDFVDAPDTKVTLAIAAEAKEKYMIRRVYATGTTATGIKLIY